MAGDLEDFLRRAAQRRQAKAAQQQQSTQQSSQRQPPQYSDRRTERVARRPEDTERVARRPEDEVLAAEVIEDDLNSFSARLKRVEEAKRVAKQVEAEAAAELQRSHGGRVRTVDGAPGSTGDPARDLIRMLQQPGGIQQAILLREIFERPEHRW